MKERIYRTPRTYGAPSGYDIEITHYPNHVGRLAEQLLQAMVTSGEHSIVAPGPLVKRACDIAAMAYNEWQQRGWMVLIEDAPGMKKDCGGAVRGAAEGGNDGA